MIMQQTLHEWGPLGVNRKIERMGMKWIEKKVSDGKLGKLVKENHLGYRVKAGTIVCNSIQRH